jgi:3-methyladenine DNA glycosylase AlkD
MTGTYSGIVKDLKSYIQAEKAAFLPRFFKTGKGQYAEGDLFYGIVVPDQRIVAKRHFASTTKETIIQLLDSPYHEERLTGLFILCLHFNRARQTGDEKIWFDLYVSKADRVNNWDLVDSSAHIIMGAYLENRDRELLYTFASSSSLWKNRIAVVATWHFIRKNDLKDILQLSEMLMHHPHDLMHKAIGWMLREAWKRDPLAIEEFLDEHADVMPRTMLRYAIEKMEKNLQKTYLDAKRLKKEAN